MYFVPVSLYSYARRFISPASLDYLKRHRRRRRCRLRCAIRTRLYPLRSPRCGAAHVTLGAGHEQLPGFGIRTQLGAPSIAEATERRTRPIIRNSIVHPPCLLAASSTAARCKQWKQLTQQQARCTRVLRDELWQAVHCAGSAPSILLAVLLWYHMERAQLQCMIGAS